MLNFLLSVLNIFAAKPQDFVKKWPNMIVAFSFAGWLAVDVMWPK